MSAPASTATGAATSSAQATKTMADPVAADCRRRILDAAADLMGRRGFAATSVSAICRQAEVTPPTLYWHFGDKQGLATEVMRDSAQSFFERLEPRPRSLAEIAHLWQERPEFIRLQILLALERREVDPESLTAVRGIRAQAYQRLRIYVEPWLDIEDEEIRERALTGLSRFGLAMLDGVFVSHQISPRDVDLTDMFETVDRSLAAEAERWNRIGAAERPPFRGTIEQKGA